MRIKAGNKLSGDAKVLGLPAGWDLAENDGDVELSGGGGGGSFPVNGTQGTGKAPVSDGSGTPTWTDVGTQAELDAETAARIAADANLQPLDSDLTAIAALTTTAFGRSVLSQANAAALRTLAALGTAALNNTGDFDAAGAAAAAQAASQPLDSDLTAIAALATTSFGRSLLAVADPADGTKFLNGLGAFSVPAGGSTLNSMRVFNVEDATYGAVADAFFQDGVAVSASTTFTSATANFTGADVGKTIVIQHAASSGLQDLHTTIASLTNSTTVVLTNAPGHSQSSARFYISRAGDQTAAIQAAIDACTAAGGGIVYCPGVGYLVSGLVLKNRVQLLGAGFAATMIHLAANSNTPVISNDVTANNSAFFTAVRNIKVDGNRARQSNITTTLSVAYTAGNSTISLTSAASFLPAGGMVTIGTNRLTYQAVSGNTLTGVAGGYEGTTDASAILGATVTQIKAIGIYFSLNPFAAQGTISEDFDPHQLVENVWIKNTKGDGIQGWGQSENRWHNVWVEYSDEISFRPSFDSWLSNCTSDKSGRHGFFIRSSEVKLSNCKAFFAGNVTAGEGHGFFCEGFTNLEEGTKILAACGAQDCQGSGLFLRNAQRVIAQFTASSNSRQGAGLWAGVSLTSNGTPGTSLCIIDAVCVERGANGNNQTNALLIDAVSNANQIRITHGAAGGATVGTAIAAASSLVGGNEIAINGIGSAITPVFAASYTPDPYVATYHRVGNLTANIAINAPANAHLGCLLTVVLRQDATGGRTITWNAAFLNTPTTVTTANLFTVGRFMYDGTNWVGV